MEQTSVELTKEDFRYEYPSDLIATRPASPRDHARLLVYQNQKITDSYFYNLDQFLPEGTLLILNDTKVFPSRMIGQLPGGAKVEVFLLECCAPDANIWLALGKPIRKLRKHNKVAFFGGLSGTLDFDDESIGANFFRISFDQSYPYLMNTLEEFGQTPLPPYIKRDVISEYEDRSNYQTIFAKNTGSVAAPTAALHFTENVFKSFSALKIKTAKITLHVGAGTFLPVKTSAISEHKMHIENYSIPQATVDLVLENLKIGKPVVAVGTTTFRSVTDFFERKNNQFPDTFLRTDLFLYPKYSGDLFRSKLFSGILTNFHQPESTLIMLISALVGYDARKNIYAHAVENKYRLFSYGDSSLLWF